MQRTTGEYEHTTVGGEKVAVFIPYPLPPANPPLTLGTEHGEVLRDLRKPKQRTPFKESIRLCTETRLHEGRNVLSLQTHLEERL